MSAHAPFNPESIPPEIRRVFEAYGSTFTLAQAVAVRSAPERRWYAILFKDPDDILVAVAFQKNHDGLWEVDDDGIGPFDSIQQFKSDKLVDRWL